MCVTVCVCECVCGGGVRIRENVPLGNVSLLSWNNESIDNENPVNIQLLITTAYAGKSRC